MSECRVCGGKVVGRGYCKLHYRRYMKYGDPSIKGNYRGEPFTMRYTVDPDTGCWLWKAGKDTSGYGIFERQRAHRVSYEMYCGPIMGLQVLHRCDTPACVNPDHLFLGTHDDNMKDMAAKGRCKGAVGARNHGARLTEAQVVEIYLSCERPSVLAKKYAVCRNTVGLIKSGSTWSHITMSLSVGHPARKLLSAEQRAGIARDDRPQKDIAKAYGVTQGFVSAIQRQAGYRRQAPKNYSK